MDRSKVIVDHLTKEQVDRSNLSKFQQFKIEKEYMTSAYKNYLAHQLFYTVSMLTRTIYQSVLYEYAGEISSEKWAMIDLLDEVISDSEERFETGQESISQEEEKESSNSGSDYWEDDNSDPWKRVGEETKAGGPKDPTINFPGIDIKIDLPPTIFTPYDHTKNDLAQEARTNADKARAEADRQHEQAKQAQEAKQAAMDAAKAAKEDVERKAEALDKLVEKTTEHKADLVDSAKDAAAATLGGSKGASNTTAIADEKSGRASKTGGDLGGLGTRGDARTGKGAGVSTLAGKATETGLTTIGVVIIDAINNGRVQATAEAQKEAIEQFKEDLKNGVPRDEALERAQEKLDAGVKDYKEVGYNERAGVTGRTYTDVTKEQTIEETIKALEEYADAKEKEAEAAKEQSEALTQAGIESAKEEMAEERAQEAERDAEQAEREAQEQGPTSSFDDNNNTTNTGEDTPECSSDTPSCGSDCSSDCGSDSPPCSDCGSDCSSDCTSDCGSDCSSDCTSDCGTDCSSDCSFDTEDCGGCDCDDCAGLGAD